MNFLNTRPIIKEKSAVKAELLGKSRAGVFMIVVFVGLLFATVFISANAQNSASDEVAVSQDGNVLRVSGAEGGQVAASQNVNWSWFSLPADNHSPSFNNSNNFALVCEDADGRIADTLQVGSDSGVEVTGSGVISDGTLTLRSSENYDNLYCFKASLPDGTNYFGGFIPQQDN